MTSIKKSKLDETQRAAIDGYA